MTAARKLTAPRERPIIFSGEMVRTILEGRKTQTRRVVKPQPEDVDGVRLHWTKWKAPRDLGKPLGGYVWKRGEPSPVPCPYGKPGDLLWVRETWAKASEVGDEVEYRADDPDPLGARWRPSIHMPRWASRLTLEVTGVRVERLQEISGEDAIAEGIDPAPHRCPCEVCSRTSQLCPATVSGLVFEYRELWDSINGKRAPWDSSPWVWVIEFRRVKP